MYGPPGIELRRHGFICRRFELGNSNVGGRIHHIDLTVRDLVRSTEFYEWLLPAMGFRRTADAPEGPIWAGDDVEIGLAPARSGQAHDRYAVGLHHLAFAAPDRASVDAMYDRLIAGRVPVLDPPAEYPQYAPGYYAVFFTDPDGIKLEYAFTPEWPAKPRNAPR